MAFERIAEKLIRDAMAEGRFEVVADGRALDLDGYFSVPADLRVAYSVLRSAGCVPEEVEYLKEVDRLRQAVATTRDEDERQSTRRALADAELRLALALERNKAR